MSMLVVPFRLLASVFPVILLVGQLCAAPVRDKFVEAELITEHEAIVPGQRFDVGLRFKIDPTWHTYWINPGEAGTPTSIEWVLPDGFEAGPLQFPSPSLFMGFGMVGFGYEQEVTHLVSIKAPENLSPGQEVVLKGKVKWLGCDPHQCVPGKADLTLDLKVGGEEGAETGDAAAIQAARLEIPKSPEGWQAGYEVKDGQVVVTVAVGSALTALPEDLELYPAMEKLVKLGEKPDFALRDGMLTVRVATDPEMAAAPSVFDLVLHSGQGIGENRAVEIAAHQGLQPEFGAEAVESVPAANIAGQNTPKGMLAILVAAFFGGLILNIMPCVFPVISLKIMSFVGQAGESRHRVLMHGLMFTLGILVFFWVLVAALLALRAGGEHLGWGFQLQSPAFVMVMIVVIFVLALSLFGVFEFGAGMTGVGGQLSTAKGYGGSFWSGALAVLLATPCTGPFLGPALGYAVSQPPLMSLLVFTVIGLGMASPYILLSAVPKLLDYVPRPGPWMETFRNLMGFPMLIVVVWLLWVLGAQIGIDGTALFLGALTVISAAFWLYGKYLAPGVVYGKRAVMWVVVAALLLGSAALSIKAGGERPETTASGPIAEVIAEHREAGRAVFVDFTAKWCLVCQANKPALHSDEVQEAFKDKNVAFVIADWTNSDPDITKILEEYGRASVPFYPLFPADQDKEPIILPQNLTSGIILDYLEKL